MAPERVTEPAVDFVAVAAPARMAETVPAWRSYEAAVRTPVLPEIVPPARVTAPTVSERAPIASVPPVLTVTAPASARWSAALAKVSVPPLTVVPPVKSLAAESVSVPAPVFVSVPAPVRLAETVPPVAVSCETAKVPPPRVPPVLIVTLLAIVSALRSKVPPLTVIVPEPNAPAAPALSVPAVTVVAPV